MLSQSTYIPNKLFFAEVQKQIEQGKKVRIRVRGSSMFPFMRHNDIALLQPPHPEKLKKGDVVVAYTDEIPVVLHRIAKVQGENITLLGDGNTRQWEHTTRDRVVAIVTHCYRDDKSWRINSPLMMLGGRLWLAMHPWRKNIILVAWRVKHLFVKGATQ